MSFELLGPQHVGMYDYSFHPAIELTVRRHKQALENPAVVQTDISKLVVVSEGGGSSGYVSGAGLVVMEQAGLIETAVDQVIGTSSGALNAASTAAKQAALGSSNYIDLLDSDFANPLRILAGRKPLNFDCVLRDIILSKKPYDPNKLAEGPAFGAVSVNVDTRQAELLQDFDDIPDMMLAIRASCAIPVLTGRPVNYKGRTMSDGALLAAVPFKAGLEDGPANNTYVVALRTCGEDLRKTKDSRGQLEVVRRHSFGGVALAELVADRARIYNEDAERLRAGDAYPTVVQIALKGEERPVVRIEKSLKRLQHGFELGMAAVGDVFGMPKLSVFWNQQGLPLILTNTDDLTRH